MLLTVPPRPLSLIPRLLLQLFPLVGVCKEEDFGVTNGPSSHCMEEEKNGIWTLKPSALI